MDTIDFGGVFAFTTVDIFTREGRVVLQPGLTAKEGQASLKMFTDYFGHSDTIQTDEGSEFEADFLKLVSTSAGHHRVARPYKKNEQAFIERFNLTVRQECLGWEIYSPDQIPALQQQLELWLDYYHFVRPSMAFDPMRHLCLGVAFDLRECVSWQSNPNDDTITLTNSTDCNICPPATTLSKISLTPPIRLALYAAA